jgi:hypothetical protein
MWTLEPVSKHEGEDARCLSHRSSPRRVLLFAARRRKSDGNVVLPFDRGKLDHLIYNPLHTKEFRIDHVIG